MNLDYSAKIMSEVLNCSILEPSYSVSLWTMNYLLNLNHTENRGI